MYPLISIIIPFYNTEKYLRRCVSSMTSQTYQNLEIILMDDGSTDQSSLIADDLSAEDSRIRVFHTANSGVAAARNNGLKNARGTFVMFVDSDDWMDPTIIQDMWERMEQTKADLVTCDIAHSVEKPTPPQPNEHPAFHLYSNKDYLRLFFKIDSNEWVHYPVAKLYQRDLLPQPLYPEDIRVGEDVFGTYLAIANAQTIAKVEKVGYFYYFNPESATAHFTEKDFDLLKVWDRMLEVTEGKDPDHAYAEVNRNRINFTLLLRLLTEVPTKTRKSAFKEQQEQLRSDLKKCEASLLHSPIVRSRKIMIYLLCHCFPLMELGGSLFMLLRKLSGNKIADAQRRSLS
ncbi:MAG: glycosyltransferase family 2 protein [Lachnospiraceae bacterium]|nr:glycosyltransferase family 2 protein [Aeriscardovia sp.]MBR3310123.1 glycosyltransferase family 2 protein [Lachnospiraceae bacterium]MBR3360293.1 glycosyltransferase family 2 protein [Lachnospiraceae bacterium]